MQLIKKIMKIRKLLLISNTKPRLKINWKKIKLQQHRLPNKSKMRQCSANSNRESPVEQTTVTAQR